VENDKSLRSSPFANQPGTLSLVTKIQPGTGLLNHRVKTYRLGIKTVGYRSRGVVMMLTAHYKQASLRIPSNTQELPAQQKKSPASVGKIHNKKSAGNHTSIAENTLEQSVGSLSILNKKNRLGIMASDASSQESYPTPNSLSPFHVLAT
jgi:hypothetical protein